MVTTELVINAVNAMADRQDGIRTAPTVADTAVQSEDAADEVPDLLGYDDELDVPRHNVGDQALIDLRKATTTLRYPLPSSQCHQSCERSPRESIDAAPTIEAERSYRCRGESAKQV